MPKYQSIVVQALEFASWIHKHCIWSWLEVSLSFSHLVHKLILQWSSSIAWIQVLLLKIYCLDSISIVTKSPSYLKIECQQPFELQLWWIRSHYHVNWQTFFCKFIAHYAEKSICSIWPDFSFWWKKEIREFLKGKEVMRPEDKTYQLVQCSAAADASSSSSSSTYSSFIFCVPAIKPNFEKKHRFVSQ